MTTLAFDIGAGAALQFKPTRLVIAGWTGRDASAIEHHIQELAALGVPRPSAVPLYYRVSPALLTQETSVPVLGHTSSGEVELVLLRHGGQWWLTLGSDHTDRAVETYSVVVSKQMCAKPLACSAWRLSEVAAHADALQMRSEILEGGDWVTYQQGTLEKIRPLAELVAGLPLDVAVEDGLVLFCGTFGALPNAQGQGVRPAPAMRLELVDPVTARRIGHEYRVVALPVVA